MAENRILSPVGSIATLAAARREPSGTGARAKPVLGLLDNSKPNVAAFLHAIERELEQTGAYQIVRFTKPRSAAPAPQLAELAQRCDCVINAVAD